MTPVSDKRNVSGSGVQDTDIYLPENFHLAWQQKTKFYHNKVDLEKISSKVLEDYDKVTFCPEKIILPETLKSN